jgi:hypothetical protein
MTKIIVVCAALALAGCGETVTRERPVSVNVPVPQPCLAGSRPAAVTSLRELYSDAEWNALDLRQKAALAGKQGLDLRTYGEDLNAATGGCN